MHHASPRNADSRLWFFLRHVNLDECYDNFVLNRLKYDHLVKLLVKKTHPDFVHKLKETLPDGEQRRIIWEEFAAYHESTPETKTPRKERDKNDVKKTMTPKFKPLPTRKNIRKPHKHVRRATAMNFKNLVVNKNTHSRQKSLSTFKRKAFELLAQSRNATVKANKPRNKDTNSRKERVIGSYQKRQVNQNSSRRRKSRLSEKRKIIGGKKKSNYEKKNVAKEIMKKRKPIKLPPPLLLNEEDDENIEPREENKEEKGGSTIPKSPNDFSAELGGLLSQINIPEDDSDSLDSDDESIGSYNSDDDLPSKGENLISKVFEFSSGEEEEEDDLPNLNSNLITQALINEEEDEENESIEYNKVKGPRDDDESDSITYHDSRFKNPHDNDLEIMGEHIQNGGEGNKIYTKTLPKKNTNKSMVDEVDLTLLSDDIDSSFANHRNDLSLKESQNMMSPDYLKNKGEEFDGVNEENFNETPSNQFSKKYLVDGSGGNFSEISLSSFDDNLGESSYLTTTPQNIDNSHDVDEENEYFQKVFIQEKAQKNLHKNSSGTMQDDASIDDYSEHVRIDSPTDSSFSFQNLKYTEDEKLNQQLVDDLESMLLSGDISEATFENFQNLPIIE